MARPTTMEWRRHPILRRYEISEFGDVRRVHNHRRLRGFVDGDGYIRYALFGDDCLKRSVLAHRVVAETFIGPPPSATHEVAHNNGSRLANHHTNLRWATRKENDHDTQVHGTARAGSKNGRAKLTDCDVADIRVTYRKIKNHESKLRVGDIASTYGIHHATVVSIATGKSWAHLPMPEVA